MNAEEAARANADAVAYLPAGFMLDGATYKRGGELGFDGVDFYTAGRGGALGDVDGMVVAAAFVFFNPEIDRRRAGSAPGRDVAPAERPRPSPAVSTPGRSAICPTRSTTPAWPSCWDGSTTPRHRRAPRCSRRGRRVPEPERSQGPGPATAERAARAARCGPRRVGAWPPASSRSRPCSSRPRSWRRSSGGPSPIPRWSRVATSGSRPKRPPTASWPAPTRSSTPSELAELVDLAGTAHKGVSLSQATGSGSFGQEGAHLGQGRALVGHDQRRGAEVVGGDEGRRCGGPGR